MTRLGLHPLAAICIAAIICGCQRETQRPPTNTVLEVLELKGACKEDHVSQWTSYDGDIVRSRSNETGKVATYGFVRISEGIPTLFRAELKHWTTYYPPEIISFEKLATNTTLRHFTIHGVSMRLNEEHDHGYDSTCEMDVVKRGKTLQAWFMK